MLLNRLVEQQARLIADNQISRIDGYEPVVMHFGIILDPTGRAIGVRATDGKERALAPRTDRTANTLGGLLWDHPDYLLGLTIAPEIKPNATATEIDKIQAKAKAKAEKRLGTCLEAPKGNDQSFLNTLYLIRHSVQEAGQSYLILDAIVRFYTEGHREAFLADEMSQPIRERAEKGEKPTIFLAMDDGLGPQRAFETPGLDEHLVQGRISMSEGKRVQCCVSGDEAVAADLHGYIKGVLGGQPTGTKLVSFNEGHFDSFGLRKEQNGPVSADIARGYHRGLNHMLFSQTHHIAIGNGKRQGDHSMIVWGTDAKVSGKAALFEDPIVELQKVRRLIRAAYVAQEPQNVVRTGLFGSTMPEFYFLALKANAARLSPILWQEMTAEEFYRAARSWYADMALVPPKREARPYLSIPQLLGAILPPGEKLDRHLMGRLFTAAIQPGTPVQPEVMDAALRAFKTTLMGYVPKTGARPVAKAKDGPTLSYPMRQHRVISLAKLALARSHNPKRLPMALDKSRTDIPYNLGRLFAVLEATQRKAIPDAYTTIIARISGAMETPAFEFRALLAKNTKHLSTLGSRGGWLAKQVAEVMGNLDGKLPTILRADEQVVFMVGYWHQVADMRRGPARAEEAAADEVGADDPVASDAA